MEHPVLLSTCIIVNVVLQTNCYEQDTHPSLSFDYSTRNFQNIYQQQQRNTIADYSKFDEMSQFYQTVGYQFDKAAYGHPTFKTYLKLFDTLPLKYEFVDPPAPVYPSYELKFKNNIQPENERKIYYGQRGTPTGVQYTQPNPDRTPPAPPSPTFPNDFHQPETIKTEHFANNNRQLNMNSYNPVPSYSILPQSNPVVSQSNPVVPQSNPSVPQSYGGLPQAQSNPVVPQSNHSVPQSYGGLPQSYPVVPQSNPSVPQSYGGLPQSYPMIPRKPSSPTPLSPPLPVHPQHEHYPQQALYPPVPFPPHFAPQSPGFVVMAEHPPNHTKPHLATQFFAQENYDLNKEDAGYFDDMDLTAESYEINDRPFIEPEDLEYIDFAASLSSNNKRFNITSIKNASISPTFLEIPVKCLGLQDPVDSGRMCRNLELCSKRNECGRSRLCTCINPEWGSLCGYISPHLTMLGERCYKQLGHKNKLV